MGTRGETLYEKTSPADLGHRRSYILHKAGDAPGLLPPLHVHLRRRWRRRRRRRRPIEDRCPRCGCGIVRY